jgi:hypothetical protein
MPNTLAGVRRRASSSSEYGMTEESSPMASPAPSTAGRSSARPPATRPAGVTTSAATHIAMVSPVVPGKRRPVAALSRM